MELDEVKEVIRTIRGVAVDVPDEVAEYTRERARYLAGILAREEPGFSQVLIAERDNVALKMGIVAAEASDQIVLGAVMGVLAVLARILEA